MAKDVADIATVVDVPTTGADTNNVKGRGDTNPSLNAQGGIGAARSVLIERLITGGRVAVAGGVAEQRVSAAGRVLGTSGVEK